MGEVSATIGVVNRLKILLNDPSIALSERVQSLWSGYGQIIRVRSTQADCSYIVKSVIPKDTAQHPRGWNSDIGYQRKLRSYKVEAHFYQHYAPLTDQHCPVPQLIANQVDQCDILLVMQDLDALGYSGRKAHADWTDLKRAIRWLAWFHGRFFDTNVQGLWSEGCYWHLATRQEELKVMPDGEFKRHAARIDNLLNKAQFQTLLHGDAKFANLCFHLSSQRVAAVDFQYAGRGSGVKDLAYLVGSCLDNRGLKQHHPLIVDEYLKQLKQALIHYQQPVDFEALAEETHKLYPVAWADFYRFLLGWNPDSWKICDFMQQIAEIGLSRSVSTANAMLSFSNENTHH